VSPPAFSAGERFTYTLSWLGISAGTAVMAVDRPPAEDGRKTFKLVTTATSNSFVSVFYPVDNRVESVVDAETMAPQRLVFRRREGRRKNDFDVTFRHKEGTVLSIKDGVTRTIPIPEGTQDAISCLYYVRSLPHLTPGTSQVLTVHHDNKNYRLEVQIEEIERLHGPWGDVETVRVLAIMPFRGIFLNEGNIRVWLTNDAHHVPVMMKAKVIVGSVRARLVAGWRETPAP
ncbi:MAG: DUF3108 domain-containing protein, partial [Nitrospiraceae bacterium]